MWIGIAVQTGEDWPELERWTTAALRDAVKSHDQGAAGVAAMGLGDLRFWEGRFLDARRSLTEAELHQEQ
jgi:hypothetical protein